ncbi:MAG: hypothetical protein KatS3mg105_0812 [Gemmatales bacterium]|nr:MAG: hypothetical protein KatS3mg105_0812 [Gemmatales bacterium]
MPHPFVTVGVSTVLTIVVLYLANRHLKPFFGRITSCLLPMVIGTLIVLNAYNKYVNGEGGFKLGVDLAGGTDLIYEIDETKEKREGYTPERMVAALKRRIDPTDLYNIKIRPVSDTRFEIILPTGGRHQAEAEKRAWDNLIAKVQEKWPASGYRIPVGDTQALIAAIHDSHLQLTFREVSEFVEKNYKPAAGDKEKTRKEWEALLSKVEKKWPAKPYNVAQNHLEDLVARVREFYPNVDAKTISDFIDENYELPKNRRNLTHEQVERVKRQVREVGSLEFRILANARDDAEAIDAARKYFADPKNKQRLQELAFDGRPPDPPINPKTKTEVFEITLEDGKTYKHTYSWVEIGKKELNQLGLNNAAKDSPDENVRAFWNRVAEARKKGEPYLISGRMHEVLLYSRDIPNPSRLPPEDRGKKKYEYFFLTRDPLPGKEVTGDFLASVGVGQDEKFQPAVTFRFNTQGANRFHELTSQNRPPAGSGEGGFRRHLAIVLNGYIEQAPRLNAVISDSGQISGGFTQQEAQQVAQMLRSGALPAVLKPEPVSNYTIGSTLGQDTIRAGTISVAVAFLAVIVFMSIYYRFAGIVASVALLANLLLTVAFMVMVEATFTLPGLAGLVLMLGMAVDANVLIYERVREERDRGSSLALALRNGYERAFPTIIDTHLSSIFTAIVLYVVGNDQLKGFGVSLTVGLIISLFTALYMTRLIFDLWLHWDFLKKLSMFRLLERPNINFMAIRYYFFAATVLATLAGAGLFIYRLGGRVEGAEKGRPTILNIDFTGGTSYSGLLVKPESITDLRELLGERAQEEKLVVEQVKQIGDSGMTFELRYKGESEARQIQLPNPATAEAVRIRASQLPDLSVEQIFVSTPGYTEGNKSRLFKVRTSERAPELVQAAIDHLLGDKLQKTEIRSYSIDESNRYATMEFQKADPDQPGEFLPAFVSPGQVRTLLTREFERRGMTTEANQFELRGRGVDQDGRFWRMRLELQRPTDRNKLDEVLLATKNEFARRPQPEELANFDSELASETRSQAFYAILASWLAILVYLWFRFGNWTFGLAAVICIVHDLFFTLGVIAVCHYVTNSMPGLAAALLIQDFKIDLAAVAALLTLVGFSVNDTIVVFDRIREVRGKNPELTAGMINDSVNQTLSRTVLTSFIAFLVVAVLYIWGGEGVHLFAFCMVVGVLVGTYSSIYIASPLLLLLGEGAPSGTRREAEAQPAEATA